MQQKLYDEMEMYFETGDYDGCIKTANTLLKMDPNDTYSFYMRGNAYRKKENYIDAIKDLIQVIDAYDTQHMVIATILWCIHRILKDTEIREPVENLISGIKSDQCRLKLFGFYYSSVGEHRKAIDAYDRAIDLPRGQPKKMFDHIGKEWSKLGEHQRAIDYYTAALKYEKRDNFDCFTYFSRAESRYMLGNNDAAIADAQTALLLSFDEAGKRQIQDFILKVKSAMSEG